MISNQQKAIKHEKKNRTKREKELRQAKKKAMAIAKETAAKQPKTKGDWLAKKFQ